MKFNPAHLAVFIALFLALSSSVEAGKKKKKKHHQQKKKKKLGAQNAACSLVNGMTQAQCNSIISKGCPVTWVGTCS